jgi:hypothetical protein
VDLSFGRQNIVVGDGFLINGDALNMGKGIGEGDYNRGGAYYLAARKAFDETAVLRLGGKQGWRSDLMWLKSDNRAQAKTEMVIGTLEHVAAEGTVGFTYIDTTDVDKQYASPTQLERDGMKTYSLRAQGNAGVTNLFLSGEYAKQDKPHAASENAWYLEANQRHHREVRIDPPFGEQVDLVAVGIPQATVDGVEVKQHRANADALQR